MITSNIRRLSRFLAASAILFYCNLILANHKADRRFESAQDFPQPPPSTHTKYQSSLDFYQPSETEDWVDGFLKSQNDHEGLFEELPGTFVGMATTLSPTERNQLFEDPRTFSDGQDPLDFRSSHPPAPASRNTYTSSSYGMHQEFLQNSSSRASLGNHQNFEPLYDPSISTFENTHSMTQNAHYYFPTPPLSTNAPTFFDSTGDLGVRSQNSRSVHTPQRLQFGSDVRFEGQGFLAPPEQETEEAIVQRRIHNLECLKPDPSPASTHPPSPLLQKRKHSQLQYSDHDLGLFRQPLIQSSGPPQTFDHYEDPDPSPKKRRKAPADDDPEFEDPSTPARSHSKRAKSSASRTPAPIRQNSLTTPRTSSARKQQASIKNNRQVLSEEQKKTNHIISEQKRRNLIKQGYEGIQMLVPSLKNNKTSKGGMLESAADWLEDIIRCNEILKHQLDNMKGSRNSFA